MPYFFRAVEVAGSSRYRQFCMSGTLHVPTILIVTQVEDKTSLVPH